MEQYTVSKLITKLENIKMVSGDYKIFIFTLPAVDKARPIKFIISSANIVLCSYGGDGSEDYSTASKLIDKLKPIADPDITPIFLDEYENPLMDIRYTVKPTGEVDAFLLNVASKEYN